MLAAKLKFFEMIAGKMGSFLRGFQTNTPVIPFMADTIGDVVCDFLRRVVLKDVLTKCSSLYTQIQPNPLDKNLRKPPESIDNGFEAKHKLEGVKSFTKELESKKEAGEFIAHLLSHLCEKSPLKYAIIRISVCLNVLCLENLTKRNYCENHMGIIQKLVSIGRIFISQHKL